MFVALFHGVLAYAQWKPVTISIATPWDDKIPHEDLGKIHIRAGLIEK